MHHLQTGNCKKKWWKIKKRSTTNTTSEDWLDSENDYDELIEEIQQRKTSSTFAIFDPKYTLTRKDDGKKIEKLKNKGVNFI